MDQRLNHPFLGLAGEILLAERVLRIGERLIGLLHKVLVRAEISQRYGSMLDRVLL